MRTESKKSLLLLGFQNLAADAAKKNRAQHGFLKPHFARF